MNKDKNTAIGIQTQNIIYQHNGQDLEGYLVTPKEISSKTPAVLLIHEWVGLGDYIKMRTRKIARLGYIAFAMDMYGKGVRAKDHKEAAELMGIYTGNISLMLERTKQSLATLKGIDNVDSSKIAVLGYCFGGRVVLELALSGENVAAGVTFHGMLSTPNLLANAKNIQMDLMFHHGASDTFIPKADIQQLQDVLKKENKSYDFYAYKNAVHGFTRISARDEGHKGIDYNQEADEKSWKRTVQFLKEKFYKK